MCLVVLVTSLAVAEPSTSAAAIRVNEWLAPSHEDEKINAIPCIANMCESYYNTKKKKSGALLVVYMQNETEFHDRLLRSLMSRRSYTIHIVNQFALCKQECYGSFNVKAKNYLVVYSYVFEVHAAVQLW